MTPAYLLSNSSLYPKLIRTAIEPVFSPADISNEKEMEICYDTFDLRLYNRGLILTKRGDALLLFDQESGMKIAGQSTSEAEFPKFLWNFEEGPLKNRVAAIIDIRALLPLCTLSVDRTFFVIQNAMEKSVARGTIFNRQAIVNGEKPKQIESLLIISPLKGFDAEFIQLLSLLKNQYKITSAKEVFTSLLSTCGVTQRISGLRYPPRLETNWSVCHTIKSVSAHLLEELSLQIPGIIEDIDTEFLHDYRVALRRFRVILGQLRSYVLHPLYEQAKTSLKSLGEKTGPLRDMDVLLLHENYYHSLIAYQLRGGLKLFFQFVKANRNKAQSELASFLKSPDCASTIKNIKEIVSLPIKKLCREAVPSVIDASSKSILTIFNKLRKKIVKFERNREIIHSIRIDCKKARYLLELFSQLYHGQNSRKTVTELKRFQTSLGDLHDFHVQQELLLNWIHEMETSRWKSAEATAAVGGLITALADLEQKAGRKAEAALYKYRKTIKSKKLAN